VVETVNHRPDCAKAWFHSFRVGFVVDNIVTRLVIFRVLRLPLSEAVHHCSIPIFILLYSYQKENGRSLGTFKLMPSIMQERWGERYFHIVNDAKFLRSLDLSDDVY